MGKRISVRFKSNERDALERDWKPKRSFIRKKRMGWIEDYFVAFGTTYVITRVTSLPSREHFFAAPLELEESAIIGRVRQEIGDKAMQSIQPVETFSGFKTPLIGVTSPSNHVYDEIRCELKERIGFKNTSLSFEEKYRIAMEVAYRYNPSEWYDTVMFTNLVFETLRGNKTAARLCGMTIEYGRDRSIVVSRSKTCKS